MKSIYLSDLNRLVNEYRGKIGRAESLKMDYQLNPKRSLLVEQCQCYKDAADICGRLAQLYSHKEQDRNEWLENQADAERQMRRIVSLATNRPLPEEPDYFAGMAPKVPEASNPFANKQPTAAPQGGAQPQAQAQPQPQRPAAPKGKKAPSPDGISDEVVESWFRESPKHGFEAVAGMEDLVRQLRNYVRNVAAAKVKEHMGVGRIHSFFLYGPPGCGKTFVIKAFVHELMKQGYSYMFLTGGDIHNSLVGEAEKRVERAFLEAQRHAPCILFIDEIDSVCRNRSTPNIPNHAMATTTAFLNGYNNLVDSNENVIFIGATNYPNMVDAAMLDRVKMIQVPLPDLKAKANRFRMGLEGKVHNEPGFTYEDMADAADNYSYRDFGRLFAELTDAMTEELTPIYGEDGDAMVNALTSGDYLLTRELFNKVLSAYHPSKKDEIIRSLDAWDDNIQKTIEG